MWPANQSARCAHARRLTDAGFSCFAQVARSRAQVGVEVVRARASCDKPSGSFAVFLIQQFIRFLFYFNLRRKASPWRRVASFPLGLCACFYLLKLAAFPSAAKLMCANGQRASSWRLSRVEKRR